MQDREAATRIYVACLASYNAGRLHGRWIEADQDAEIICEEIEEMLSRSPEQGAEEWAIHDYEGFAPYNLSEYESLSDVARIANGIRDHGTVFAALLDHHDGDFDDTHRALREDYHGAWRSLDDYVEETMRDCHDIPAYLDYYIDWAAMGRDMQTNGELYTLEIDSEIHVFQNR